MVKQKVIIKTENEVELNLLSYPNWCVRRKIGKEHKDRCCACGDNTIYFQCGDGKGIHSLCIDCYNKYEEKE